jgi:hypothetical protein
LRARWANLFSVQSSLQQQKLACTPVACVPLASFFSLLPVPLQFGPACDSISARSGRRSLWINERVRQDLCTLLNANRMSCWAGSIQKTEAAGASGSLAREGMANHRNHFLLDSQETALQCDHGISFIEAKKPFAGSGRP